MITFAGSPIPGTHEQLLTLAPQLQAKRTKYSGVVGESEITQSRGGRDLSTHIWIHNAYSSSDALVAYLENLDGLVGTHGDLVITRTARGGVPRSFPNCTFEGFFPDPERGALPDVAGTLDGGWWIAGTLRWHQLYDGK